MCFFENNCPKLERLGDKEFPEDEHHAFFPRALFKKAKWKGKLCDKIKHKVFRYQHERFNEYFARNCVIVARRHCSVCVYKDACCHSSTQPEEIRQFVKSHCSQKDLLDKYPQSKENQMIAYEKDFDSQQETPSKRTKERYINVQKGTKKKTIPCRQ